MCTFRLLAASLMLLAIAVGPACLRVEFPLSMDQGGSTGHPDSTDPWPPWPDLPPATSRGPAWGTSHAPSSGGSQASTGGPVSPAPPLTLTAVLFDPDGADGGPNSPEFVELQNQTDAPQPLDGLVLVARSWPTLTAAELGLSTQWLDPGAYLVVFRYADPMPPPTPPEGSPAVFVAHDTKSGLRNGDGAVGVEKDAHEFLDLVVYGGPPPEPFASSSAFVGDPVPVPGAGVALCRRRTSAPATAADWAPCDKTPGTDLPPPPEPANASVVLVEVLANPVGPSSDEKALEYAEVLNLGPDPIDLGSFTVADSLEENAPGIDPLAHRGGDGGCVDEGAGPPPLTCLAPGFRALLVGGAYLGPTGNALVLETDDTTLANGGLTAHEPVVLRDGEGTIRSTYRAWPDPTVAPDPKSDERAVMRPEPTEPDLPGSWIMADPSPGT